MQFTDETHSVNTTHAAAAEDRARMASMSDPANLARRAAARLAAFHEPPREYTSLDDTPSHMPVNAQTQGLMNIGGHQI